METKRLAILSESERSHFFNYDLKGFQKLPGTDFQRYLAWAPLENRVDEAAFVRAT